MFTLLKNETIMKTIITILLMFFFCGATGISQSSVMPLLFPEPIACVSADGTFDASSSVKLSASGSYAKQLLPDLRAALKQYSVFGNSHTGKQTIQFVLDKKLKTPTEGYTLEVTPSLIVVKASSEPGLFYGKESLIQLLRYNKGKIPACKIEDYPKMAWRGVMLDEARHFFGMEKVKQLLDVMASLKLNVFHWHLTDEPAWRIEIKQYPKLTTIGSVGSWDDAQAPSQFYTQKEIKDIVKYAADRHIMVVPEIDMPGHATAACKSYPEISGGGTGRWKDFTYHPCKEETFEFLSNVLDEVAGLFPSPYIHVGGDEVHYGNQSWYTDPMIQGFIKDNNLKNEVGLEHYFIRRVADIVHSKEKMMIGWDEIVDAGVSPDKAVVMWWRHDKENQLDKALQQGYKVIMTPRRPFYFDFVQDDSHKIGRRWGGFNTVENVCDFPGESVKKIISGKDAQILGLQMSVWTERIADNNRLDFMIYPRITGVAEAAWNPEAEKKSERLMKKLPCFLEYLNTLNIYYFNPFNPAAHPEPDGPSKADVLQEG